MSTKDQKISSLLDALENTCKMKEHSITFINSEEEEVSISYRSLRQKALELLHGLQAKGICKGDEVILQLSKNEDFIYVFWACIMGGIIPVPVPVGNNDEHKMKLFKIWNILNKPFLICDRDVLPRLEVFSNENGLMHNMEEIVKRTTYLEDINCTGEFGLIFEAKSEDIAFIQFSSGSTGDPKGVVMTHGNLVVNIIAMYKGIECSEKDSSLSWMPLTHDMGLIGFHLAMLVANINQFIMPTALFIKRPTFWLQKASEHKVTFISSPNFGYKYFMEYNKVVKINDIDLSNVRIIFNGAEPISAEICNEFLDKMEKYKLKRSVMLNVFGMAEACLAVSFPPVGEGLISYTLDRNFLSIGDTVRIVSDDNGSDGITLVDLGSAVQDCSIRICSADGSICSDGVIGYIQIKGENVTLGYYNNQEATLKAITKDGWLDTGDVGFMRNDRLVVTGRAKEIIFVNGQNYYPYDIENVCCEIEGVEFGKVAACGAFNDSVGRDEIVAFVIYNEPIDTFIPLAAEIKRYVGKKIGIEIAAVVPVTNIPKTASGKIQHYKLGEDYKNGKYSSVLEQMKNILMEKDRSDTPSTLYSENEARILEICREVFKNDDIGLHDNLYELGVDSIKAVQVVSRLNEEGILIDVNDILTNQTVYEICSNLDFTQKNDNANVYDTQEAANEEAAVVKEANTELEKNSLVKIKQEELDDLFE